MSEAEFLKLHRKKLSKGWWINSGVLSYLTSDKIFFKQSVWCVKGRVYLAEGILKLRCSHESQRHQLSWQHNLISYMLQT